jgi:hypothetical protein
MFPCFKDLYQVSLTFSTCHRIYSSIATGR